MDLSCCCCLGSRCLIAKFFTHEIPPSCGFEPSGWSVFRRVDECVRKSWQRRDEEGWLLSAWRLRDFRWLHGDLLLSGTSFWWSEGSTQRFAWGGPTRETLSQGFYPKTATGHGPSKYRLVSIRFLCQVAVWHRLVDVFVGTEAASMGILFFFLRGPKNDSGKWNVPVSEQRTDGRWRLDCAGAGPIDKVFFWKAVRDKKHAGKYEGKQTQAARFCCHVSLTAEELSGSVRPDWVHTIRR